MKATKRDRAEMASLGRKVAEQACSDDDDAIDFPEESAVLYYPYRSTMEIGCPLFAAFKAAFVGWIRDTYEADKVTERWDRGPARI